MADRARLHAVIHGHVQGVFYRAWTVDRASELGITGYVRNLPSGTDVEVDAEGEREKLEQLLVRLKSGPAGARVETISASWPEYRGTYRDFKIRY